MKKSPVLILNCLKFYHNVDIRMSKNLEQSYDKIHT